MRNTLSQLRWGVLIRVVVAVLLFTLLARQTQLVSKALDGTVQTASSEGYKAGYAAREKEENPPDLDTLCPGWLFNTNLAKAKEKICKTK